MNALLIHEAIHHLQTEMDADAGIRLDLEVDLLQDMAKLLDTYRMARKRKLNILGCYLLLQVAIARHRKIALDDSCGLAKNLLDGDYCFGLYYRYIVKCNELKLLSFLAPFHKKLQIELVEGRPVKLVIKDLYSLFKSFLDDHVGGEGGAVHETA